MKEKPCFSSTGTLILAFSILAVQAGIVAWNMVILSVIFMVCLLLVFIIWRQPESRTPLSFKVGFALFFFPANPFRLSVSHMVAQTCVLPLRLTPRFPWCPSSQSSACLSMFTWWCSWIKAPGLGFQSGWQ